jgi:regulatory protein
MTVADEVVSTDTTSQRSRAQAICLRQLAVRGRSRTELERALSKREIDADVAAEVLDEFTAMGYIDDEAYAAAVVRAEQINRGMARRMIAERLRQRGVADDVIERAVASVEANSENAMARELAVKKLRLMTGLDKQTQARRLQGYLLRRGYPAGLVVSVCEELLETAG